MSSILKALRKVEEEKARKQEGALNLARDVLRAPRETRGGRGVLLGAAALLFGVAAAGGLLLLLDSPEGAISLPRPSAPVRPPAVAVEAPRPHVRPASSETPAGPSVQAPRAAPRAAVQPPSPSPEQAAATTSAPQPHRSKVPEAPEPVGRSARATPSRLVLSGIAYQASPAGRMAVINNLPVMEGTMIEGAQVTEILPDRVRFRRGGESFEIVLEGN